LYSASFDIIYIHDSANYADDRKIFEDRILGLLKDDGILLVSKGSYKPENSGIKVVEI
jgi:hypothetical protein